MSASDQHAVAAGTVFDGSDLHHDCAVVIEGHRIAALLPLSELPAAVPAQMLPEGAWLAPGFIDVQVNGGGDVLFNDDPTPDAIAAIARAHRSFGTTALLPTLISDTPAKMRAALDAVQQAVPANPSVLGIHLEGPFLSPQKPGVHDPAMLRRPTVEDVELLTATRTGVTLVTLAPEQVPAGFIAQLAKAGVRISLGHSMATYAQTKAALAQGLTGFTHLFNAMRQPESREPGPAVAALEAPGAWFGMIVDGHHVDPAMLRLALRGAARPMLVTDAMPTVGGSRSTFLLGGQEIGAARRPLHQSRRHARRRSSRHGIGRAQLRRAPRCASRRRRCASPPRSRRTFSASEAPSAGSRPAIAPISSPSTPVNIQIHATWVAGRPVAAAQ